MKKQHETVTHLACTRNAYAQSTGKSEKELAFTVSRTEGGKWLLYSQTKLIKPHDYVSSDFDSVIRMLADEESVNGQENVQKAHSSGPHTTQYTFASVGVQVAATSIDSSQRTSGGGQNHHGWQPALMTSFMWLANVTGEFIYQMGEDITTVPKRTRPRLVDDPRPHSCSKLNTRVKDINGLGKYPLELLHAAFVHIRNPCPDPRTEEVRPSGGPSRY